MEAGKAKIFSAIADLKSDMLKLSKSVRGLCDELQKCEILIGLNMLVSEKSASMYDIIDEIIMSRGDWIASREIRSAYARKTGRRLAESTLRHYLSSAPNGKFIRQGNTRGAEWKFGEIPPVEDTE